MSDEYQHTRKVSRLPPLPDQLDPILEEKFKATLASGGQIINLHRIQGHAPILAKVRGDYAITLRNKCQLSRKLLELTILRTATMMDCAYELDHHVPLGKRAGLSEQQIAALKDWRPHAALFTPQEQALLAFVDGICDGGNVSDATYADVERHFPTQQIVELAHCATSYYANALFVKTFRLQIDEPHVKAAPGKF